MDKDRDDDPGLEQWVTEAPRKTPVVRDVDVLVVGGGPAGISAALAAGRMGASTLVVEYFGCLGGNATSGLVNHMAGITSSGPQKLQFVKGIGGDIIDALAALEPDAGTSYKDPSFNPETLKRALDRLADAANVERLYYTAFTEPIMDGNRVIGAVIENKGGRQAILAKRVVDASGDGDVVVRAGAPFTAGSGRGVTAADFQASDLVPLIANVAPGTDMSAIGKVVSETSDAELASYLITRRAVITKHVKIPGIYRFNWNNIALDGDKTDPVWLSKAAIQGRESAAGILRFLNERVPGFEHAKIVATGAKIGLRESRRVHGDYLFTREDFLAARKFPDAIGANAWPLENVTATGRTFTYLQGDDFYTIPYRSLLPRGVENVIMAGRFMSGDHEALASFRVMGPAMVMGHAAGVAGVLSIAERASYRKLNVRLVQEELLRQGAFLG
jgi:glycine/D-amino acid oxidase-like deaminating enzyme